MTNRRSNHRRQDSAGSIRHVGPGLWVSLALLTATFCISTPANAFCGFYVSRADGALENRTSRVVLARDGDVTTITMANDYGGDPREFAVVIPVPEIVERHQIAVSDRALIDHLDAFSGPRLVEYHDSNPCWVERPMSLREKSTLGGASDQAESARADGVEIEARYSVGEYEILILSALESDGLARWLRREEYRLPPGAERILDSYLAQEMFFFVAKVDLGARSRLGFEELRPLRVRYTSRRFMLPLRLGTLNADGPQDLVLWTLTRRGRVEPTNYRTVRVPTNVELPLFVREAFGEVYGALFAEQVRSEGMRAVVLEHAWDTGWCDPCAADPLRRDQLETLGATWAKGPVSEPTFVTRLHVRYTAETFPDDLRLQETGDRSNFQARYVLRHPWRGEDGCAEAEAYRRQLEQRREQRLANLSRVTGWSRDEIRRRFGDRAEWLDDARSTGADPDDGPWWRRLWPGSR